MDSPEMAHRIVLLTAQNLKGISGKTAINLIRYRRAEIVAVLDPGNGGKTCQMLFGLGGDLPVFDRLDQAPPADTLIVGVAPAGGKLPDIMRQAVLDSIARGMTVVSGLHDFLSDDPELQAAADRHRATLIDVRKNNEREVAHRKGILPNCLRIQTVGHDCNVGKMVVSLELAIALRKNGYDAKFVATGQTGIMIEGDGCPVDAVVVDFINGASEKLVLAHQHHEILLIEGQGSIIHPRYSAVTLGLLHGCVPDGLILCYEMGRETVYGMDTVRIPPLAELIRLYETMANAAHPCRVIGVAMNSHRASAEAADQERTRLRQQLGLPICDVIRHGPDELLEAVLALRKALGKSQ